MTKQVTVLFHADILEGNSKGIMRVILAMAERYLPHTVKARATNDPKPPRASSDPKPPLMYVQERVGAQQRMTRAASPPDRWAPLGKEGGYTSLLLTHQH